MYIIYILVYIHIILKSIARCTKLRPSSFRKGYPCRQGLTLETAHLRVYKGDSPTLAMSRSMKKMIWYISLWAWVIIGVGDRDGPTDNGKDAAVKERTKNKVLPELR